MGTQLAAPPSRQKPKLVMGEIWNFAFETFSMNKVRFALTALGMVMGTASLILVVTIGLTGKQYVLDLIQSIGSNMIYAYYEAGGNATVNTTAADFLTVSDERAVRQQVPGISASSPMVEIHDRITVPGGKERDILLLGVSPEYRGVRKMDVITGRFFDDQDSQSRNKVVNITEPLAKRLYGSADAAVGQTLKISGLPFTVIGTFKERVDTMGQSEIGDDTILVPYTVSRYFTGNDKVKQIFFSVGDASDVPAATAAIGRVLQSRHRPESVYRVENLTQLLSVASKIADGLTAVLLLISLVTLVVSGVGIMNIMLSTVSSRIREIGIRKAIGATKREIRYQFLAEAMFISLVGGTIGMIIGVALPFSVRVFTSYRVPIKGWSVIIALVVSSLVGVIFGTVPAARAASLDPVESLRYE